MTAQQPVDVSLVVPVHHRSGSLDRLFGELDEFLDQAKRPVELVLVDDRGTHPDASAMLAKYARRSGVRLIVNERNRGKGFSVARGMLAAHGKYRVFTDADLAYPLDDVWKIASYLDRGADVAIACRVHPDSQYVMSARYLRYIYTRHVLSRIFNAMVRMTLVRDVLDTQAGLKGYTARAASEVFPRVSIPRFGFDMECLFVAQHLGFHIEQVPIVFRYNDEPTTVRFVRDAYTMASDLARIRWRGWTGVYDRQPATTPGLESAPEAARR